MTSEGEIVRLQHGDGGSKVIWGFIKPSSGARDLFFHRSGLIGNPALSVGAIVQFDRAPDRHGGEQAINVQVVTS